MARYVAPLRGGECREAREIPSRVRLLGAAGAAGVISFGHAGNLAELSAS